MTVDTAAIGGAAAPGTYLPFALVAPAGIGLVGGGAHP